MTKSKTSKNSNYREDKKKKAKNAYNAVTTYDFTSFDTDLLKTKDILKKYCKKWCFQLEECPTTKKNHYQGRLSLKVKERLASVRNKFIGWSIRITSSANIKNDFYVSKEDTRLEGPWMDTDEEFYIPLQVRNVTKLHTWQQQIIDSSLVFNDRIINVLYNPIGCVGKSIICSYCAVHKIGRNVPFFKDFKDIMRIIMCAPTAKLYLFDIPRAIKKDKLNEFYAGIECIKNGYAFDDRFKFKEKYFDSPCIWVFTNVLPDKDYFSNDRWKFWDIKDDQLVEYIHDEFGDIEFIGDSDDERDYRIVMDDTNVGIPKKKKIKQKHYEITMNNKNK